ncbi:hypothetical protein ACFRI7_31965 [Streptomyces sp. NPDC056716]|uniref:hypothetical protein n=1 Tax=unclassified Streptomyces TaxID=2593676 RepID=UPI0036C47338
MAVPAVPGAAFGVGRAEGLFHLQHVKPRIGWKEAAVTVTDTVGDPVTSDVTAGPSATTYALSGGLADLLAGKPNDGFTLTPVKTS